MSDVDDEELLQQPHWREQMMMNAGGDSQIAIAICDAFLVEVPMLVGKIRPAIQTLDLKSLKTATHTLKSCLRYVANEDDVEFVLLAEQDSEKPDAFSDQRINEIERIANRWIKCVKRLREELDN